MLSSPWSNAVWAQDESSETDPLADVLAGHSFHGSAFNEGARQAARLLGGTGKIDFGVTTDSKEASQFFNQGLRQLHGFWDLEAERSFRQVAMIDPDCAMAYWGAALATFEKPERASGFAQEALDRIENASPRERQYIKALHRYFYGDKKEQTEKEKDGKEGEGGKEEKDDVEKKDDVDANEKEKGDDKKEKTEDQYKLVDKKTKKERAARYLKDLEDIVIDYPDDIEAKALVVHRIWYNGRAGWPIGSYVAAESLLKEIFAVNPMHPSHHYRIHVWDRRKPKMAIESAGMCGLSSPAIAHMWHMPGHIFSRLNRYDEAVYYQEASARTDHRHMITDHVIPDQIHNYSHNNEWLTRNYAFLGRATDALNQAMNLVELPRHPKFNTFGEGERGSAVYGQKRVLQVLREFQMFGQMKQVVERGCFDNLEVDEQIAAIRLQGCFAAINGDSKVEQQFVALLDGFQEEAEADSEEAKSKVESLKEQLEKKEDSSCEQDQEQGEKVDKKALGEEYEAKKKESKQLTERIKAIESALKAIEGYRFVGDLDYDAAHEALTEAEGEDESWLAELKVLGGETEDGLSDLREQVDKRKNESIPLARLAWCEFLNGELDNAKATFEKLKTVAIGADRNVEVFARLDSLTKALETESEWVVEVGSDRGDTHFRPPLSSLGPVYWEAPLAPKWSVMDADDEVASSESFAGENYLMIFYLGHGCLHCAEQLQAFAPRVDDFENAGIGMIAISSDDQADLSKSLENFDGDLKIRLASDSALEIFKSFRAHDDFEGQPLHGTFLIDRTGRIRWQDISYEPFMDHEFLLEESKRLLKF